MGAVVRNCAAVLRLHVFGELEHEKKAEIGVLFLQEFNTTEETLSDVFRRSVIRRSKNL